MAHMVRVLDLGLMVKYTGISENHGGLIATCKVSSPSCLVKESSKTSNPLAVEQLEG